MLDTFVEEIDGVRISYVGQEKPTNDDIGFILNEAKEYASFAKKKLTAVIISRSSNFNTASAFFCFGPDDRICKHFSLM